MTDTIIGYVVTCQGCGRDALQVQKVSDLQGEGEGGMVRASYIERCDHCDGQAS
jgi:hypothetical protein